VLKDDHKWSWQLGKGLVDRYYIRAGAVHPACLEHASTSAQGGKGLGYEYFETKEGVMAYAFAHGLYTPQEEESQEEIEDGEDENDQETEEDADVVDEVEHKNGKRKQDDKSKKGAVIEDTHDDDDSDNEDEDTSDNEVMMSQMVAAEAKAEWEKSKAALAQDGADDEDDDDNDDGLHAPYEWQWSDVWAHLNYLGWKVRKHQNDSAVHHGMSKIRMILLEFVTCFFYVRAHLCLDHFKSWLNFFF